MLWHEQGVYASFCSSEPEKSRMRRILALLAITLLPACALTTDYIEVRAPAPVSATPVPGAERVNVSLAVRDSRQIRDRVSNKINGYGMEMAPIIATNDVLAEAQEAITTDLRGRGFRFGGTDGRLELEFTRFFSRFQWGFWSGTANAEILMNLRLLAPDGRLVHASSYNAQGVIPGIQLAGGDNARLALEAALARLIQLVGDDQELQRAITTLAPAPTPPAPARRGRVGA
jgi:uncharacterized lipoprotein